MTLERTPEIDEVISHLEAARAAEAGLKLQFESHEDLELYRRKLYVIKRKIHDAGVGDFSDILARIASDSESTLLLIKESATKGA